METDLRELIYDHTYDWNANCNKTFASIMEIEFAGLRGMRLMNSINFDADKASESFLRRFNRRSNIEQLDISNRSIEFIRDYADYFDWGAITYGKKDDAFYREFIEEIDFRRIYDYSLLSEEFICEFIEDVDKYDVLETANISNELMQEFISRVDWNDEYVYHQCRDLEAFLTKFVKNVNWSLIREKATERDFSYDFKCQFGLFKSFENLKKRIDPINGWIKHELIEYLHQPRFVEKWLCKGNELEDYLM